MESDTLLNSRFDSKLVSRNEWPAWFVLTETVITTSFLASRPCSFSLIFIIRFQFRFLFLG